MSSENCRLIADLLVPYDDGELPQDDRLRVEAHLAECAHCRAESVLLRRSLELARAIWAERSAGVCADGSCATPRGRLPTCREQGQLAICPTSAVCHDRGSGLRGGGNLGDWDVVLASAPRRSSRPTCDGDAGAGQRATYRSSLTAFVPPTGRDVR